MKIYHIGISGGKDSTALLLWALFKSGLPIGQIRVTFCDTQNEDILTLSHLRLIEEKILTPLGIKLEWLHSEGFFALARRKSGFPSRKAQFCTHDLKLEPTRAWLRARWGEGHEIVMLNGKRTGESAARKKTEGGKPERAFSDFWGTEEWAPMKSWTLDQVYAIHREFDFPLNPLYSLGVRRVGCFPCVNCTKEEIRVVAKHRPEKIAQIDEWEKTITSERGQPATFFHAKTATKAFKTQTYTNGEGEKFACAPIAEIVQWAKTVRGGKQFRLELDEQPTVCMNGQLLCE